MLGFDVAIELWIEVCMLVLELSSGGEDGNVTSVWRRRSDSSASRKKVHSVKPPSGNSAGVLVFRTNSGKCYEVIAPPCTQVFRTFLRGIRLERLRCVYLRAGFIRPGKRLLQCTVSPRNETGRTNFLIFVAHVHKVFWNFRALVGLKRGPCVEKRY